MTSKDLQLLNSAAVFLILFLIAPLHAEVESRYKLIGPRQAELVNRYDELVRAVRADDHELITNLVNEMYGGKFPSDNTILLLGSDLPTFKLLEGLGARTDVRDRRGMDVLLIAAQNGELDLVRYLISRGFNVNAKNVHGWSPLHFAAGDIDAQVGQVLIESGAYVNAQRMDGVTPLMVSVLDGNVAMFDLLLRKGAMHQLLDCAGRTIEDYLRMDTENHHVEAEMIDEMRSIFDRYLSAPKTEAGFGKKFEHREKSRPRPRPPAKRKSRKHGNTSVKL